MTCARPHCSSFRQRLLLGLAILVLSQSALRADGVPEAVFPPAPTETATADAFTGKVNIHCAALRIAPTADALAIAECERSQLVKILGTEGDFYQVSPPEGLKAYIASRYIHDQRVQGERVNLRARPNTESTILGQVNTGDEIHTRALPQISEWVEVPFPAQRKIYIRKELVTRVGDIAAFEGLQQKRQEILVALQRAVGLAEKAFGQFKDQSQGVITWNEVRAAFDEASNIAASSPAFTEIAQTIEHCQQSAFESYQKAFSDSAHSIPVPATSGDFDRTEPMPAAPTLHEMENAWTAVEHRLMQQWLDARPEKNADQYWQDQELTAQELAGTLSPYMREDLRQRPGDFVLYQQDLPIAYLYSATVDLAKLDGKYARYKVVKREDLGFALPAYCVISIAS